MKKSLPIDIVFLLEELNFGGTQKQTLELIKHLDRTMFAPQIWTLRAGEQFMYLAKEANVSVHILCNHETIQTIPAIIALFKALRKNRPTMMHLCTAFPNVWGRILGRIFKVPIIIGSCRGQINVKMQFERFLWSFAQAHICNAKSIAEELKSLNIPSNLIHFIPNGVDTALFKPKDTLCTEPELICVGRMVPEKDHETLFQALAIVLKQNPKVHLNLVGEGHLQNDLQKLACTLGIEQNITFHGVKSNIWELMQESRAFVLSSINEGMPNVLLEAMSCALPVISTNVDGIPDLVQDGEQGILVNANDAPALAAAILQVLNDTELATRLGLAGRKHVVQNYSLQNLAQKHESIYKDLCNKINLLP